MKYIIAFIICQFGFLALMSGQEVIDFSGEEISLYGWASDLTIEGHDENHVQIIQGSDNESKQAVGHEIKRGKLMLSLKPNARTILIKVPKKVNLTIDMEAVVYETKFDPDDEADWRNIKVTEISGDLTFNGDGYDLQLDSISGSAAIVTYGDIDFTSSNLSNSELISLDTYWGDVIASIPSSTDVNVTARAKKGKVSVEESFYSKVTQNAQSKFVSTNTSAKIDVILHSEGGKKVELKSN